MDLILNRVAWMYYYGDMKQQDIADKLNISRVTVNRLLKQAQKEGVVEITINSDHLKMFEYEDKLQKQADLDYVVVVPDTFDVNDSLCRGLAHLLNDILDYHGKLGLGLSKTLKSLYKYINKEKIDIGAIVSVCGTSHPDLSMTPLNIGFTLSEVLHVSYHTIWAPVIVSDKANAQVLKQDIYISKVLDMAKHVDMAIVGIGDVDSSNLTEIGYISDDEIFEVKEKGAVGEIIGNYYDINGQKVESTISERLISVDFPMECPVIGIAGGERKLLPILGAIKSGMIQGLVVNESVAEELLERL